jgi:hypothetical protein
VGPSVQPLRHPWGAALLNKRTALALLARSHASIMDVGLHDLQAGLMDAEGEGRKKGQGMVLMVRAHCLRLARSAAMHQR